MKYGSVCSGIEAATVAWHPLGWRPAFFSEIEAFPRAVLAERWPGVPIHGDFTTIGEGDYEPIELLVGGTPCQDFSVAGLRAGLLGDRGGLTIEFVHLARRLRPRWLVWENVPGILSIDGGRAFGAFLALLGQCGYGFAYRILDARHFGVPQRRRRVFVVGYLGDWRPAAAVLFEPESLRGDPAPRREAGERIARPIAGCPEGGSGWRADADTADNLIAFHGTQDPNISGSIAHPLGRNSGQENAVAFGIDSDCLDRSGEGADGSDGARSGLGIEREVAQAIRSKRPGAVAFGGNNTAGPLDVATACNAHGGPHGRLDFESETFVTHSLRADGFDASEDGTGRGTPLIPYNIIGGAQKSRNHAYATETSGCLQHKGLAASGNDFSAESPTVNGTKPPAVAGMTVRRLTPVECEKLQGFPPHYTAITYRGKTAADGPRYRALGNSMAVPCMRWIGERIGVVEALIAERVEAAA